MTSFNKTEILNYGLIEVHTRNRPQNLFGWPEH